MTVIISTLDTHLLYPLGNTLSNHLLEIESNSGPKCGRRDYTSEKFQLQYRESNPRRWEDNIKTDLQEVGGGFGDWMELAQDRDRWRALMSTVMNFRVP